MTLFYCVYRAQSVFDFLIGRLRGFIVREAGNVRCESREDAGVGWALSTIDNLRWTLEWYRGQR